jgi:ABC-type multidrug transport system fused ATPase/permease subunit
MAVFNNSYFMSLLNIGANIKSALVGMIYAKAFHLSSKERSKRTIGELVNHMAIDANIFNDMTFYFYPIFTPIIVVMCVVLLWQEIGVSNLAGIGVIILFFPLNFFLGRRMMRLQRELMEIRDSRSKLTNEVLQGIRVIKFFVWESKFLKQISEVRKNELAMLKKLSMIRATNMLIWVMMPLLISVASFALYTFLGNELTPEKAFTSLAIYNVLRQPASWMPRVIAQIVESRVSLKRMQDYLQAEELNDHSITRIKSHDNFAAENVIEVHNASFDWNESDVIIPNLNLHVKRQELVGIVGPVGAGKSSLLQALLGEMPKRNGRVVVVGQTAYCPQQAWMHNCSLRENVTFGLPYEKEKYDRVLSLCELQRDLTSLPAGDLTEIGEKGINLSGGQKQRVSLARALYQDADVYLLDDCLSAVDAHVGKRIFENCIKQGLASKTVILVTHQLQYLPFVDRVIVMEKGQITEEGHYDELMARGMSFSKLMSTHNEHLDELFKKNENGLTISSEDSVKKSREIKKSSEKPIKEENDSGKLIQEEERAVGSVSLEVFKYYIFSWGSVGYLIFYLIFVVMDPSLKSTSDWWLSQWSNSMDQSEHSNYFYLLIYFVISMVYGLDAFGYTILVVIGALRASVKIHDSMLYRVLRAPVSFFDTTPIGRILNRFNKDQSNIDDQLSYAVTATFRIFFYVAATIIVISLVTPAFLGIVLPLAFVYRQVQQFYSATSLQLRRLDSVTRSPIYALFSSSIAGLSTIRAFARVEDFSKKNLHNIDTNNRAWLTWIASNRWLSVRLQFIGAFVVFIAALFAISQRAYLTASLVGFAITYALSITDQLVMLVRTIDDLNNLMISVERCKEYLELPSEASEIIPEHRPPADWPTKGGIEIKNLKIRYRPDLPLVLQGVTCEIKPAENIGIVGRTGAGKSSLMSALLRLVEPEEGHIVIDGINTSTIGLDDLRSKIGIIPQDPLLFTGTIRSNLDPFDQYTDEDLWRALGEVQLTQSIKDMDGELSAKVNEGGDNLSVGTRQLLCLARSLLQKPRILLMDEASANVDFHTNVLIQQTIKERFSDITVITIAHRIHTVMDCNRIMVLDRGSIVEFDSPQELLKNKSSQFYLLVKESRRKEKM